MGGLSLNLEKLWVLLYTQSHYLNSTLLPQSLLGFWQTTPVVLMGSFGKQDLEVNSFPVKKMHSVESASIVDGIRVSSTAPTEMVFDAIL